MKRKELKSFFLEKETNNLLYLISHQRIRLIEKQNKINIEKILINEILTVSSTFPMQSCAFPIHKIIKFMEIDKYILSIFQRAGNPLRDFVDGDFQVESSLEMPYI